MFCSLCLLLLTAACGSASTAATALESGLPGLAGLDAIRRPSIIESFNVSLVQPHSQLHTAPLQEQRNFNPAADELAWAIFQVEAPAGSLDSLLATGSGSLYLLVADFASQRWVHATPLSAGQAAIDLSADSGLISPGGSFYAAALTPALAQGGMASTLSSLALVHDQQHAGNTYYVTMDSKGGSDAAGGTAQAPWATLQHAADTVQAGDTVIVRPGDYTGFWLQSSGTELLPIRFSALDGANIIFPATDKAYGINLENWQEGGGIHDVVVEGFTIEQMPTVGIRIAGTPDSPAHHITLRHNICRCNGRWGIFSGFVDYMTVEYNQCSKSVDEHGIYLSNSGDFNIARGNICYGNAGGGIQFNADASQGGDGIMSEALIEGNICFDNGTKGGAALNMDGLQDSVIRGNLLYNNHASGITLFSQDGLAAKNNVVTCNTIIQAMDPMSRWCIRIANASTGNTVINNILWSRHSFRGAIDIDLDCLPDFSSDYNLVIDKFSRDDTFLSLLEWQSITGQDSHSVMMVDESFFHDAAADDYHITLTAPAEGIGIDHPDNPPLDFDGVPRPQPVFDGVIDAGCYEAK